MQGKQTLAGISKSPLDARNDAALFAFLLVACLAYNGYASYAYLTSFKEGIFDFAWRPIGRDFINYWSAAVALFDGMILPIFDVELFHAYQEWLLGHAFAEHNWSYPPHMLLMVWPFGQLPYLWRSEEHPSELQSLMRISYAVFCLQKKKQTIDRIS